MPSNTHCFKAAELAQASINARRLPWPISVSADTLGRRLRFRVQHRAKLPVNASIHCADFWARVPDDLVTLPGIEGAISEAITKANAMAHLGRDVF